MPRDTGRFAFFVGLLVGLLFLLILLFLYLFLLLILLIVFCFILRIFDEIWLTSLQVSAY